MHTPIATPLEFTNFGRPVQPFVPGETRNFGFRLTAAPEIQQKATPDLDGDVDRVHAIGGAAAEAGDADAVAGGFARGGGQRRGRARARGRGKPLTRRIAASAAAPRRAPDTPVRGAVRLS